MKGSFILVSVSLLISAAACNRVTEPEPSLMSSDPFSVGEIVARDVETPTSEGRPTVHVRRQGEECGIIYAIPEATPIKKKDGSTFVDVPLEDLRIGLTVAVWAKGVLDSCPGQSGADAIEVLR